MVKVKHYRTTVKQIIYKFNKDNKVRSLALVFMVVRSSFGTQLKINLPALMCYSCPDS